MSIFYPTSNKNQNTQLTLFGQSLPLDYVPINITDQLKAFQILQRTEISIFLVGQYDLSSFLPPSKITKTIGTTINRQLYNEGKTRKSRPWLIIINLCICALIRRKEIIFLRTRLCYLKVQKSMKYKISSRKYHSACNNNINAIDSI